MSLRLRLMLDFPHRKVLALGVLLSFLGITSIIIAVIGFSEKIWGYYMATGLWCGVSMFLTGLCGVIAAQLKRPCSVKTYFAVAVISTLLSVVMLVLSAGGLDYSSNFYRDSYQYKNGRQSTQVIHVISLCLALFGFFGSLLSAALCVKYLFFQKSSEFSDRNSDESHNVTRRSACNNRLRDSQSSRAPLQPVRLHTSHSQVRNSLRCSHYRLSAEMSRFLSDSHPSQEQVEYLQDRQRELLNSSNRFNRDLPETPSSARTDYSQRSYLAAVELMPAASIDFPPQYEDFTPEIFGEDELPPYEEAIEEISDEDDNFDARPDTYINTVPVEFNYVNNISEQLQTDMDEIESRGRIPGRNSNDSLSIPANQMPQKNRNSLSSISQYPAGTNITSNHQAISLPKLPSKVISPSVHQQPDRNADSKKLRSYSHAPHPPVPPHLPQDKRQRYLHDNAVSAHPQGVTYHDFSNSSFKTNKVHVKNQSPRSYRQSCLESSPGSAHQKRSINEGLRGGDRDCAASQDLLEKSDGCEIRAGAAAAAETLLPFSNGLQNKSQLSSYNFTASPPTSVNAPTPEKNLTKEHKEKSFQAIPVQDAGLHKSSLNGAIPKREAIQNQDDSQPCLSVLKDSCSQSSEINTSRNVDHVVSKPKLFTHHKSHESADGFASNKDRKIEIFISAEGSNILVSKMKSEKTLEQSKSGQGNSSQGSEKKNDSCHFRVKKPEESEKIKSNQLKMKSEEKLLRDPSMVCRPKIRLEVKEGSSNSHCDGRHQRKAFRSSEDSQKMKHRDSESLPSKKVQHKTLPGKNWDHEQSKRMVAEMSPASAFRCPTTAAAASTLLPTSPLKLREAKDKNRPVSVRSGAKQFEGKVSNTSPLHQPAGDPNSLKLPQSKLSVDQRDSKHEKDKCSIQENHQDVELDKKTKASVTKNISSLFAEHRQQVQPPRFVYVSPKSGKNLPSQSTEPTESQHASAFSDLKCASKLPLLSQHDKDNHVVYCNNQDNSTTKTAADQFSMNNKNLKGSANSTGTHGDDYSDSSLAYLNLSEAKSLLTPVTVPPPLPIKVKSKKEVVLPMPQKTPSNKGLQTGAEKIKKDQMKTKTDIGEEENATDAGPSCVDSFPSSGQVSAEPPCAGAEAAEVPPPEEWHPLSPPPDFPTHPGDDIDHQRIATVQLPAREVNAGQPPSIPQKPIYSLIL